MFTRDFNNLPFVIRTIITSLAEVDICNAFESGHYVLAYELDIISSDNSDDILSYFRHRMALIRAKNR
jgi:hypothetical protein